MSLVNFQMPEGIVLDEANHSTTFGRFIVQPLEKGFGVTIGNAFRRVLLSSLPGYAITAIRIEGIEIRHDARHGIELVISLARRGDAVKYRSGSEFRADVQRHPYRCHAGTPSDNVRPRSFQALSSAIAHRSHVPSSRWAAQNDFPQRKQRFVSSVGASQSGNRHAASRSSWIPA